MMHPINVLGIESSCDDTAVAVVNSDHQILANIVISQQTEHAAFKGVVPEIAARSHLQNLQTALSLALSEAQILLPNIDVVAATCGPGLIGGVIVGSMFAKALSSVLKKPFIAVNHLEGHALTVRMTDNISYPYILLLASGGHCQFVAVKGLGDYVVLGQTLDDAAGEAFDKVAKMLGLGFPGGPEIQKQAVKGKADRFNFPKPLINRAGCDMSFSGLKTAVRLVIEEIGNLTDVDISDIAASFQRTVAEILSLKMAQAIHMAGNIGQFRQIVLSGGVGANLMIRSSLENVARHHGYDFIAPPIKLCTDNAAMIAFVGLERFKVGAITSLDFKPLARWELGSI